MSRSNLSSSRRGGEIFRPAEFRRTDHPVCGASEASRLFINAAATPPFQGGECVRSETVCQFAGFTSGKFGHLMERSHIEQKLAIQMQRSIFVRRVHHAVVSFHASFLVTYLSCSS